MKFSRKLVLFLSVLIITSSLAPTLRTEAEGLARDSQMHRQNVLAVEKIYIRSNGTIDPPDAPISTTDNITYTLSDNINASIVVEKNHTIIDGVDHTLQGLGSGSGITIIGRNNITIMNVEIRSFANGIRIINSFYLRILRNCITSNDCGVFLDDSDVEEGSKNITISQNEIKNNMGDGITVEWWPPSDFVNISDNMIMDNGDDGIFLKESSFNTICRNNISRNHCGIQCMWDCLNNTFIGNRIEDNSFWGIRLSGKFNVMRNNTIIGSEYNFGATNAHDIDESNTVNDKPICHWVNRHNASVPPYVGYVSLVNSTNILVEGLELSDNIYGISLRNCRNVTVKENRISTNIYGISIGRSSANTTVSGNLITGCSSHGVSITSLSHDNVISKNTMMNAKVNIDRSNSNTVVENNITKGTGVYLNFASLNVIANNTIAAPIPSYSLGIGLSYSNSNIISGNSVRCKFYGLRLGGHNNTVFDNTVKESKMYNIELHWASQNRIYHNHFIHTENWRQFNLDEVGENSWDNGYPSGGNYWSSYNGVDMYSGPYQNETGSDEIGDTPQTLNALNIDRYPLMILHDVGIENINLTKTVIPQNFSLQWSIRIRNHGNENETLNVTVTANSTIIQTEEVTLAGESSMVLSFSWNTSGLPMGIYVLSILADIIPGEPDPTDNIITRELTISVPGDVDGDYDVDIYDIVTIANAYGTFDDDAYGFVPNGDLDGDGDIDIHDVVIATEHYGEEYTP